MNALDTIILDLQRKGVLNSPFSLHALGNGENNENHLITMKQRKYVLRICTHGKPAQLIREYHTLQKIPKGIGPKPLLLGKTVSGAYMLQSYIKGSSVQKWSRPLLFSLGKMLAQLHLQQHHHVEYQGVRYERLDLQDYFDCINLQFYSTCLVLKKDKALVSFTKKLRKNCDKFTRTFPRLTYSRIHGDLAQTNILMQKNKIFLLDWEFSHIMDPARDFATFFYDDHPYNEGNWRIVLANEARASLLEGYQGVRNDPFLAERISFWIQFDKLCGLIYMKWKLAKMKTSTLSTRDIQKEIFHLQKSLEQHL
jgi:Ser/Thr protein kinase RdoA (MazF antagonist)